jgi:hypothetical protein
MTEYKFHPLADEWPLMEGDDLDNLAEDIKANGQREPIVIHEGMILDGRNRIRACLKADVKPTFRQFDPATMGSPEAFVISVNANRRHLDLDGKKAVAAIMIRRNPNAADRAIGRAVGLDNKTVGKVRGRVAKEFTEFKETWKILGPQRQREFAETFKDQLLRILTPARAA